MLVSSQAIERKRHNSGTNMLKRMPNNPNLDHAIMNVYENLSNCSQDIERKRNSSVNQGP